MARHETQSSKLTASAPADSPYSSRNDWLSPAVFIIGGVAAVGLVMVAWGAYFAPNAPNLTAVTAGVAIMLLAATAWVLAAAYLIASWVKRWFTDRRPASQPGSPEAKA